MSPRTPNFEATYPGTDGPAIAGKIREQNHKNADSSHVP